MTYRRGKHAHRLLGAALALPLLALAACSGGGGSSVAAVPPAPPAALTAGASSPGTDLPAAPARPSGVQARTTLAQATPGQTVARHATTRATPAQPRARSRATPATSGPGASPPVTALPTSSTGGGLPAASTPRHGDRYWALIAAVSGDPEDPGLDRAERQLRSLGYPNPNRAELDCLQGARDGLRLPEQSRYEVDVLFATRMAADQVAAAYPGTVAGVVRVTAYCLD